MAACSWGRCRVGNDRDAGDQLYESIQEVKVAHAVNLGNSKETMKAEGTYVHNFQI